jgi:hypothetical protein
MTKYTLKEIKRLVKYNLPYGLNKSQLQSLYIMLKNIDLLATLSPEEESQKIMMEQIPKCGYKFCHFTKKGGNCVFCGKPMFSKPSLEGIEEIEEMDYFGSYLEAINSLIRNQNILIKAIKRNY